MLRLYNAGFSVCSVKVRIALAEKQLDWEDILLTLPKGEQFKPDYLNLNPDGVVPTLIDGDLVLIESSVIVEHVDTLSDENPLMPTDPARRALTKLWLLRCLDIHSAIHTMTFSTAMRDRTNAARTPKQHEAALSMIPNPQRAIKHRDVLEKGLESAYVDGAFFTLKRTFDDMQAALDKAPWLTGEHFALADVALLAYIDRLDRIGLAGLWQANPPIVGTWLKAARARASYERATVRYTNSDELQAMHVAGSAYWPAVNERWEQFLQSRQASA